MTVLKEYLSAVRIALSQNGISLPPEKEERLAAFCSALAEKNREVNLTAITDPSGMAALHICDSLSLLPLLPQRAKVLDLGCGPGIPGLPLAIVRDDLSFALLDATAKKLAFAEETASLLGIKNVAFLCIRAEEAGKGKERESFDVCISRAVARLPVLLELCLPFVAPGGFFVAMKSEKNAEELAEAGNAPSLLGAALEENRSVLLRKEEECFNRSLLVFRKEKHTPAQYPRPFAAMKKNPLGRAW